MFNPTVCPRSVYPFYIVTDYMKWVKTYWTYSSTDKTWVDVGGPEHGRGPRGGRPPPLEGK